MNRKVKIGCGLTILLIAGGILGAILSSVATTGLGVSTVTLLGTLAGALLASLPLIWIIDKHRKIVTVFCLLLIVVIVSMLFHWHLSLQKADAINKRYSQFCSAVLRRTYKTAYPYMSPEYRATHTVNDFKQDERIWTEWFQGVYSGMELYGCEPDPQHYLSFSIFGNAATFYPGPFRHYEFFGYSGPSYEMVLVGGEWYFTGEVNWYTD